MKSSHLIVLLLLLFQIALIAQPQTSTINGVYCDTLTNEPVSIKLIDGALCDCTKIVDGAQIIDETCENVGVCEVVNESISSHIVCDTLGNEYLLCKTSDGIEYRDIVSNEVVNPFTTIEVPRHFIGINFNPPDFAPTNASITYGGVTVQMPNNQLFDETPCNNNAVAGSISFQQWMIDNFPTASAEYVDGSGCDAFWMCGEWSINLPDIGSSTASQSVLDIDPDFPNGTCTIEAGLNLSLKNCESDDLLEFFKEFQDSCCIGGGLFYDISQTNFVCSKLGFELDNAFTSICPDGWTCEGLASTLNEGNPTGTVFACDGGNLIVVSGESPELIQFFHSGGGTTTVLPEGGESCKPALSTKECNSAAILAVLESIEESACGNTPQSNVVCASSNQTGLALVGGGTVDLVAGEQLIIGESVDCKDNPQSFSLSVLVGGVLVEIEDPVDAGVCPSPPNAPLGLGCIKDTEGNEWNVFQVTLNGTETVYYIDQEGTVGTPSGEDFTACGDVAINPVCKSACVGGVSVEVIIGVDNQGNELWYTYNGEQIEKPDFQSTCPEKQCTTETISICADGDYTGITDGDAFSAIQLVCNDGSKELLSMASVNDLTQNVSIPAGFIYTSCAGAELVFNGCVVDEDGVQWDSYTYNGGVDFAFKNNATGEFGTPNGNLVPCPETFKLLNALPDKHCVSVAGDVKTVWLFAQEDKRFCAVDVISGDTYAPNDFILVSCCGEESTVNSTYLNGFTVARPANTPNTGWNNQVVTGTAALVGDYNLCFTPADNGGNSPNMIGVNTDPNTNASYTSIDHAVYLYVANGTYLFRLYENGSFVSSVTINWSGQEVCFSRVGSTLEISLGGTVQFTRPTTTADQFLDDSHYFANGFWGSGSVTYSDFELVQDQPTQIIKSQSECKDCCINIID